MAGNANFMTWNPLYLIDDSYPPAISIIREGNVTVSGSNSNFGVGGTMSFLSGKWYWEICTPTVGNYYVGLITKHTFQRQKVQPHNSTGSYGFLADGTKYIQTSNSTVSGFSPSNNDVLQLAFDRDNMKLWLGVNGTYVGSGNPATGTNPTIAATDFAVSVDEIMPFGGMYNPSTTKFVLNAGQDSSFVGNKSTGSANSADGNGFGDFYYAPPSGFLAPCSANTPTATAIDAGETEDDIPSKLFNAVSYSGTGTAQTVSAGFRPDLVWIKQTSGTNVHEMYDSSRGATKRLQPDSNAAEDTRSTELTAFATNGFTLGTSTYGGTNNSTSTYIAWCWRVNGGTTSTNTSGTITSTVQANDNTGLSIVLYTGDGTQGATVGHGLSGAPDMVWTKNRSYATRGVTMNWIAQLGSQAGSPFDDKVDIKGDLKLSNDEAKTAFHGNGSTDYGGTIFTSSVFPIPNNGNAPYWFNGSTDLYLAYCWKQVPGFSKFGFYYGNANEAGPYVYCGFRPRLIMTKSWDDTGSWRARDTARDISNPSETILFWDTNAAQANNTAYNIDFLSNGFRVTTSENDFNKNEKYFMYMAWADVSAKFGNTHAQPYS